MFYNETKISGASLKMCKHRVKGDSTVGNMARDDGETSGVRRARKKISN